MKLISDGEGWKADSEVSTRCVHECSCDGASKAHLLFCWSEVLALDVS
jgi:hypothetical protein